MIRLCFSLFCNLMIDYYVGRYAPNKTELVTLLIHFYESDKRLNGLLLESGDADGTSLLSNYYTGKRQIPNEDLNVFMGQIEVDILKEKFFKNVFPCINKVNIETFCGKLNLHVINDGYMPNQKRKNLIGAYEKLIFSDCNSLTENNNISNYIFEVFLYSINQECPNKFNKNQPNSTELQMAKFKNFPYLRNDNYIHRYFIEERINECIKTNDNVALFGLPGNGKTQIVLEFCYSNSNEYSMFIWIDATSYQNLLDSYISFLESMEIEIERTSPIRIIEIFGKTIKKYKDIVIIYDNLCAANFPKELEFESIIGRISECKTLITSNRNITIGSMETIPINGFTIDESVNFIKSNLEFYSDEENDDIALLSKRLDCNPLALAQAVICINKYFGMPIREYIERLDESRLNILKSKTNISSHDLPIYESFMLLLNKIDTENSIAGTFIRIMSLFPDYEISSIVLNRMYYDPYRFTPGNYVVRKRFNIDKYIDIYKYYSNCGQIALNKESTEYFDGINLPLYKYEVFDEVIDLIKGYNLCDIYFGGTTMVCFHFGVRYFRMRSIFGEIIRSSLLRDNDLIDSKYLDYLTHILYYIGPQKPFDIAPEAKDYVHLFKKILPTIFRHQDLFMKEEYDYFFKTIIHISTALMYRDIYNYEMNGIKPEHAYQEELWSFILEYCRRFYDEDFYQIKKLEYFLAQPPFGNREAIDELKEVVNYFYPTERYSNYWNAELEFIFSVCESGDKKIEKIITDENGNIISHPMFKDDPIYAFRHIKYYSQFALMQRRLYQYRYPQYFEYCFGLIKNWDKVKYDELKKAYRHERTKIPELVHALLEKATGNGYIFLLYLPRKRGK